MHTAQMYAGLTALSPGPGGKVSLRPAQGQQTASRKMLCWSDQGQLLSPSSA